jgi:hypothetical protein
MAYFRSISKTRILLLTLGGILCILLSQYANVLWGRAHEGDDPFFFPAAFMVAAVYGWWSRNYPASFLVGLLAVPYLIPFPGFYNGSVIASLIKALFNPADYNLTDLAIFLGFGIASGLCGMGFARLARWRKKEKALSL